MDSVTEINEEFTDDAKVVVKPVRPKSRIQHLLAKIVGSDMAKVVKPKTKNEYMLNQIKGLPVATADDNGKAVVVDENGAYALATPSGGSNAPLICTDTEGTLDKTMGEIQTAYFSGRPVFVGGNLVVHVTPVSEGKFGLFNADLSLGIIVDYDGVYDNVIYHVTDEATESAALAAYPISF